jgi:hypothetical protein
MSTSEKRKENISLEMLKIRLSPVLVRDQMTEKSNLWKDRFILSPSFKGFSSWLGNSIAFGPKMSQNITVESAWWSEAAHHLETGGQG